MMSILTGCSAVYCLQYIFDRNDKSEHITNLDNVVRIIIVWSE